MPAGQFCSHVLPASQRDDSRHEQWPLRRIMKLFVAQVLAIEDGAVVAREKRDRPAHFCTAPHWAVRAARKMSLAVGRMCASPVNPATRVRCRAIFGLRGATFTHVGCPARPRVCAGEFFHWARKPFTQMTTPCQRAHPRTAPGARPSRATSSCAPGQPCWATGVVKPGLRPAM